MKTIVYHTVASLLITLLSLTSAAGELFYYHNDNFGTPMAMTDKSGEVVWRADELPFGEEYETEENPIKNNRRFLGKELDESTGLICMGSRYLDPDTGRFTQPDPVRLVDPATGKINHEMLLNPQRQNRYVYGLNNPYKYVDPDGEWAVLAYFAAAKMVAMGSAYLGLHATAAAVAPEAHGAINSAMGKVAAINAGETVGFAAGEVIAGAASTTTVYRVFGNKAKSEGFSWTNKNPYKVNNFRNEAGLPDVNSGQYIVKGKVNNSHIIKKRPALPLDGNKGGINELIINPKNVTNKKISKSKRRF